MGCGQSKTSTPAQVQDAASEPSSAVPPSGAAQLQQEPLLLGNETTLHQNQESGSKTSEPAAESMEIPKPNDGGAEPPFTVHEGCIPAGNDLCKEVMMVAEAKRKASELPGCKGFCFQGVDGGRPVEIFFKSEWKLIKADTPWTAFKLEDSGTTQESTTAPERSSQQTGSEKPKESGDSDLAADVESAELQARSQLEATSQEILPPVASPSLADEEAASPEKPSQSSVPEKQDELNASAPESAEKPAEKTKRFERQMCC